MEKERKISIIVPVYGVENYLDQCIWSIVDQTYQNLEIILVDDGSMDNCPALCDAWEKKDNRIKVIHKKNGGLSDARNAGISYATGELIGFVDGDDYLDCKMYELLLEKLNQTDSDIAVCGVQMFWEDRSETQLLTKQGEIVLENADAMRALLEETWLKQPVWNKLYKREVVAGILFEKGKYHEDVFWSYQMIARAKRVCVFDTPCYFYRQRNDSIMGVKFSVKRLDALEAMSQRINFLKNTYPDLVCGEMASYYFGCIYDMQAAMRSCKKKELNEIRECLKPHIEQSILTYDAFNQMPFKQKVWYVLSRINFDLTCRLRNCLKVGL